MKLQKEIAYEEISLRRSEQEKNRRMFGSKGEMKQAIRRAKNKNNR